MCQPLDSATCIDNNARLDGCVASAGPADVPTDDGLISGCPALSDALHREQPEGQEAVKTTGTSYNIMSVTVYVLKLNCLYY